MASHGLIQWTCIATVTSKVSVIFKSSTWGIDGNVITKQAYLLNFVIVVRSSMIPLLLSSTKLSMQMCQSTSNGCTFFIYGNQAWSLWFLSHTWNIFWDSDLRSRFPYKNSSNLSFPYKNSSNLSFFSF